MGKTDTVEEVTGEVVPDEQPTGSELVSLDDAPENVLVIVDRHDEAMIVQELQRRALKVMLYSFPQDGKTLTDLSYLGVNEAIRQMNNTSKWQVTIDPGSLTVETVIVDGEPHYVATVYAVNRLTGYGQYATSSQPQRMKLTKAKADYRRKDGKPVADDDTIVDQFARQKAINKAQRNALRVHIPEEMRQVLIAQYHGDADRVQRIPVGPGADELADLPPALTDDRAKRQTTEIRKLYDELRGLDPMALPPAAFHAYLVRAEGSHEKLDDFIGYLKDKRRQVQEALAAKEAV